jgi:hypothetical protein
VSEIRERAGKATPGPWRVNTNNEVEAKHPWLGTVTVCRVTWDVGDSELIAACRTDVPFLCDIIDGLLEELERSAK